MKPKDYSTKQNGYNHLSESERYKIEALLEGKKKVDEIAAILCRDRSTIYREINRGSVVRIQSDLSEKKVYRADVAQRDYVEKGRNKERSLKIGKDTELERYIKDKLINERKSPDVIIGKIKSEGLKFAGMICTKTLYNYIEAGIFSGISNDNLWEKGRRKKRRHRKVKRVSVKNRLCRSIEERPVQINNRLEYGHWEGDCVKGPRGSNCSLFTLTERKFREEIILKIAEVTQEAIKESLDKLEEKYGEKFKIKFKSITFDNGVEFLDWRSLELSTLDSREKRTVTYFAHAYSSWERGTNENHNKMIRRFIPKGTNISNVGEEDIKEIQDWMNNYPRKILNYKTPNELVKKYFQDNSDLNIDTVAL